VKFLAAILFLAFSFSSVAKTCTYSTYKWNSQLRKAIDFQSIKKSYSDLTRREIDPRTGCSVCEEDQVTIRIEGAPKVKLCKAIAARVKMILTKAIENGFPIRELVGYRVGMTKGNLDASGNRTQFSNHSFGTALDINSSYNGLYDNCVEFNQHCNLIKGGEWDPQNPYSIEQDHPIITSLLEIGLKWGGSIKGKQKDFMHFSFTGY